MARAMSGQQLEQWVDLIRQQLRSLQYGVVQIVVHDSAIGTNRSNREVAPVDIEKPDGNPLRKSRLDDWRLKPKQLGDQPNKKGGFDMQLNAIDELYYTPQ